MYSAVVLTKESQERLVKRFVHLIPKHWEIIAHHVTINMGPLEKGPVASERLGEAVDLTVKSFAANDKVMAVGVDLEVPSKNPKPHITIAVNREAGGKPVMSNKLKAWEPILDPFELTGFIQEVG